MSYDQVPSESHQFIQPDEDDLEALSFSHPNPSPTPSGPSSSQQQHQPSYAAGPSNPSGVSGKIGQDGPSSKPRAATSTIGWGGVRVETRYTGESTLDEPVSKTIMRDLNSIYAKLILILYPPKGGHNQLLRDWDLWGPLVICLALAIILSLDAPQDQSMQVFSLVISLITIGSVVVTVNSKLLGGKVSFFQSLCVLGYAIAPILIASIVAFLVHNIIVRIPVTLACWGWSVWASMNFFNGTQLPESRIFLAVYPMCLFFFVLAWMIIIQ
ncbi:terbinafine resistance locus protein [Cryptococcus gattii Ru294]|uniref:Protein YIP n=1 Tax=Cryptococcus gattii EJB2 TaxID=1296103 RepID=A0ABR5BSI8_9TREE|nr:terbinafine resistance locus protein [Cryptococcus gattii Ru294]KIR78324.1 terbinafine resistance locus protein [Cryptococcus gattii EJB2]KIY33149.1 terbinafine resistance locus protein [Cryptococcus gattii E566]KJE02838.1 terbinafine resistance locus protein [Cryptococcus gattii NT-10]